MKNNMYFIVFGLLLISFIYIINRDLPINNNALIISELTNSYEGKILNKVAVRKNLVTHIKVRIKKDKDTLIFFPNIKLVKIGETIRKEKNSPFCFINNDKKLVHTYIPERTILDEKFPNNWRIKCQNEWKEAVTK